ncbi:MAG: PAS domain S-box protein [Candidatus Kapabacteria bacterium]|nr:PAS domain S-box protein [Candidatus Kapabacteria bacterium]
MHEARANSNKDVTIHKCRCNGLWEASTRIYAGGIHIADWYIGQVRDEKISDEEIISYSDTIGADNEKFINALKNVKSFSESKFRKVAEFLNEFAGVLSEKAYRNFLLTEFIHRTLESGDNLNAGEERLKLSLWASRQGLISIDLINDKIRVTDEFAGLLNGQTLNFEEKHQDWILRIHPEDREKYTDIINKIYSGSINSYKLEFRIESFNGSWIWVMVTGSVSEYDNEGKAVKLIGTYIDINDKKNAEESLRISFKTLSDIIQSIPSGLLIYRYESPDKLILTDGNKMAEILTGLSIDNFIGKEFSDMWPNSEHLGIKQKFLNVVKQGTSLYLGDMNYFDDRVQGIFKTSVFNIPGGKIGVAFENITEIIKSEKALIASEERYRMLVENQNELILKLDTDFKIKYAGRSFSKMFGKTEDQLIGVPIQRYIDIDNNAIQFNHEDISQTNVTYYEHKVLTVKGPTWIAWSIKAVTEGDELKYYIAVGRDISSRKLAEIELEEKKRQSEILAELASALSAIINPDNFYDFLNQELKTITGSELVLFSTYDKKNKSLVTRKFKIEDNLLNFAKGLISQNLNGFVTPLNEDVLKSMTSDIVIEFSSFTEVSGGKIPPLIDKAMKAFSGFNRFYTVCYVIAGELFGVSLFAMKENQPKPQKKFLKSFAHISAIALRRIIAEEKLNIVNLGFEQSPALIIITDSTGVIEYVNPSFTKVTGYEQDFAVGKNFTYFNSEHSSSDTITNLWNNIKDGKVWYGEFCSKKKNDELYWESAVVSPIINDKNEITNLIAIKQDITQLKKVSDDLIAAKEKAEESDRLKTAFLQNVSHEIRTPLNGIIGFTQLMKMKDITEDDRIMYSDTIEKSGKRLIEIINNVLEISKIETGQTSLKIAPLNLKDTFDYLFGLFSISAEEKGLDLYYRISKKDYDLIIDTDELKFNQIMINLIGNAIKFTDVGEIVFGYSSEGDFVRFFVKDTGQGIKQNSLKKVFERFYQDDIKISRDYEGAGLGLAICKGFIDLLGGDITVYSTPHKGSEFIFRLPVNSNNL